GHLLKKSVLLIGALLLAPATAPASTIELEFTGVATFPFIPTLGRHPFIADFAFDTTLGTLQVTGPGSYQLTAGLISASSRIASRLRLNDELTDRGSRPEPLAPATREEVAITWLMHGIGSMRERRHMTLSEALRQAPDRVLLRVVDSPGARVVREFTGQHLL